MRTSIEGARGCGYRKPGGLYLVAPALSEPCPLLPLPLDRCPHCGQGFGPARGFTWVTPPVLFPARPHGSREHDDICPLGVESTFASYAGMAHVNFANTGHRTGDRAGLIWVGEKFYATPGDFMTEAATMGVSRRIKALPRGFKIGEHWIYLGHRKAIDNTHELERLGMKLDAGEALSPEEDEVMRRGEHTPGVITLFRPTAVEYVVKGDETEEQLADLEKRGIEPVRVVRDIDVVSATFEDGVGALS